MSTQSPILDDLKVVKLEGIWRTSRAEHHAKTIENLALLAQELHDKSALSDHTEASGKVVCIRSRGAMLRLNADDPMLCIVIALVEHKLHQAEEAANEELGHIAV